MRTYGYALQCRVTTEDPENHFVPDYGRIAHYRSAGGMGMRLDAGTAFSGAVVTPYLRFAAGESDGLGTRFADAARRWSAGCKSFAFAA